MSNCHDAVNRPKHYTSHPSGVECITITEHYGFNVGNALKYLWRAGLKSADQIEDLRKAEWYVAREIERLTRSQFAHAARFFLVDRDGGFEVVNSPTGDQWAATPVIVADKDDGAIFKPRFIVVKNRWGATGDLDDVDLPRGLVDAIRAWARHWPDPRKGAARQKVAQPCVQEFVRELDLATDAARTQANAAALAICAIEIREAKSDEARAAIERIARRINELGGNHAG